jgi:hypothetical protein
VLLRSVTLLLALGLIGFAFLTGGFPGSESTQKVTAPEVPFEPETIAVVATDTLNVRDEASLDAAVIDTLPQGARLEILGDDRNGFTPVQYGTGPAWMATEFLDVDGDSGVHSAARREDIQPQRAPVQPDVTGGRTGVEAGEREVSPAATVAETRETLAPAGLVQPDEPVEDGSAADSPVDASFDIASESVDEPGLPAEDDSVPEPPPQATVSQERWIEVERSTGVVTLHEGETVVATYQGRIGKDPSADGFYSTALGTFHVFSMNRELAPTPFAEGVYLTDFVGFDPVRSNGFHSPARDEWGNEMPSQNATTLGCVRLDADAAVAVFDFSSIGMRVEIHD